MKRFFITLVLFSCAICTNAQITILNEDVQEKIVSKPSAFDSLSNLSYQRDPIQYKKYIGYKLYCLPVSNKYRSSANDLMTRFTEFRHKEPREIVIPHEPYIKTDYAKMFVYLATTKANDRQTGIIPDPDTNKLKGEVLKQYREKEADYESKFTTTTDVYKAKVFGSTMDLPKKDIENYAKRNIFTPYDSIQNTYFTILNIEIAASIEAKKGHFSPLENWSNRYNDITYLRFTLKNETSGEELYWVHRTDLNYNEMFLVPFFEKMQKTYKGQNVVLTTNIEKVPDVNSGEAITMQPKDVWHCYEVTFVNLKDKKYIHPFVFLEKDGTKVMIDFNEFIEKRRGILTEEDGVYRPAFILEKEYNEILADRKRAEEERQRIAEEKQRQEDIARQEWEKRIIQKYGNKYGKIICERKVCLNMTKEMCIEAWGEPLYVNSTIVKGLVHEQWVYGWQTYLYFDNNILTAIQN